MNDFLLFNTEFNNAPIDFLSAANRSLRIWEKINVLTSDSLDELTFCYNKSGSISRGEDSIWIDALSFTPITVAALTKAQLCTALDLSTDNCSQIQSVSFDPPFFRGGLPRILL